MKIQKMKKDIANALYTINANDYPKMCNKLGLSGGTVDEAFKGKKIFVHARINDYSGKQLLELMNKIKKEYNMNLIPEEKYSYIISNVTKKEITKLFIEGMDDDSVWFENHYKMTWNGDIDELEFIRRVINIDEIEVIDKRCSSFAIEYNTHRLYNKDYDDNYFFEDERLPYKNADTKKFLDIITEIFHPEVRNEKEEWSRFLNKINTLINADGFEIYETSFISNRPIYGWRKISYFEEDDYYIPLETEKIVEVLDSEYFRSQVTLMKNSLVTNTTVAIGKAKELLESCLIYILDLRKEKYDKNDTLIALDKKTRKILKLEIMVDNKEIPGLTKIISALSTLVHGISELRNSYGDGHGKNIEFKQLDEPYARLAVHSCVNYIIFLLDVVESIEL